MSAKTRALVLAACVLSGFLHLLAYTPTPVESRIAAQNALFDEAWQTSLKMNPVQATAVGDYRYNDQLDDRSLAAIEKQHAADEAFLARLSPKSVAGN